MSVLIERGVPLLGLNYPTHLFLEEGQGGFNVSQRWWLYEREPARNTVCVSVCSVHIIVCVGER